MYSMIFIIDHYPNLRKTTKTLFADLRTLPFFIILAFVGIGLLISVLFVKVGGYEWPGPGLFTFTLWEWLLALMFIVITYRLALGLPEKMPPVIKKGTKKKKMADTLEEAKVEVYSE